MIFYYRFHTCGKHFTMKTEDIKLTDIKRILIGDAPLYFLAEVLIRTCIMYILLLIVVKLLGKRMSGQLTITELAVMILMGAIVSAPMELPERGVVQGLVILVLLLLLHQALTWLEVKYKKIEHLTQGSVAVLVKDGIIQLQALRRERISKDQLFAVLRNKNIFQLGQVQRVYLETCGLFTVYKATQTIPGLSTYPPEEDHHQLEKTQSHHNSCQMCGYTVKTTEHTGHCPLCGQNHWETATL